MKNNLGQVCVEFNKTAVKLFTRLYNRHEDATKIFHPRKDEKSLLHLNDQYLHTLKYQLDEIALSILDKYKIARENIMELQRILNQHINFYLQEFNRKVAI